jgi:hypothetical protein
VFSRLLLLKVVDSGRASQLRAVLVVLVVVGKAHPRLALEVLELQAKASTVVMASMTETTQTRLLVLAVALELLELTAHLKLEV